MGPTEKEITTRDDWIARNKAMTLDGAKALLSKRAAALELHMATYPDTLDRSMEETAVAIRIVLNSSSE